MSKFVTQGHFDILNRNIDFEVDTIRMVLVNSTYTALPEATILAHTSYQDILDASGEASGTGYTAGGITLASKTITQDSNPRIILFSAANPSWNASGGALTAAGCVILKWTGVNNTSTLITFEDFGGDQTRTDDTFEVNVSSGLWTFTAAS